MQLFVIACFTRLKVLRLDLCLLFSGRCELSPRHKNPVLVVSVSRLHQRCYYFTFKAALRFTAHQMQLLKLLVWDRQVYCLTLMMEFTVESPAANTSDANTAAHRRRLEIRIMTLSSDGTEKTRQAAAKGMKNVEEAVRTTSILLHV